MLRDALAQDSLVDLESLKQSPAMPAFEGEAPDRRLYLPPPLSRADALKPWKKKAYQAALKKANDSYRRDQAAYDQAEIEHTYRLATEGQAAAEHNQAIDQITRAFAKGEPEAIVRYYKLALEASAYPSGFPSMVELEYAAESAELRIQRALPAYDVIPGIETYVFDRDTREIAPRSHATGAAPGAVRGDPGAHLPAHLARSLQRRPCQPAETHRLPWACRGHQPQHGFARARRLAGAGGHMAAIRRAGPAQC